MTDITIQCKNTMVHPNAIKHMLEKELILRPESQIQASKLFLLASTLPNVPAGILLDLVQGKVVYMVNEKEETFTIFNVVMP